MNSAKRQERMDATLARKQPSLMLFLDDVHDTHNLSAIVRSCDSVGVLDLYYCNQDDVHFPTHKTITQGAHRWVNRTKINQKEKSKFLQKKQQEGVQLIVTSLDASALHFREADFIKASIIVMGNEKEGVSKELLAIADKHIYIPMQGMVQSLNVSVATALILYEAQRQRELAGMYSVAQLSQEQRERIKQEWIYRDTVARRSKGRIPLK